MMKKNKKKYMRGGSMKYSAASGQTVPQILKREKLTYKKGGKLKPVDAAKNPGLAKLPTGVRNKMGFMAMGGKMNSDKDFMYGGKTQSMYMKGGKMKYPGGGMMKKNMYPGGGRMQHD